MFFWLITHASLIHWSPGWKKKFEIKKQVWYGTFNIMIEVDVLHHWGGVGFVHADTYKCKAQIPMHCGQWLHVLNQTWPEASCYVKTDGGEIQECAVTDKRIWGVVTDNRQLNREDKTRQDNGKAMMNNEYWMIYSIYILTQQVYNCTLSSW